MNFLVFLLESSLVGVMIASYLLLLVLVVGIFIAIYDLDKYEFLNNRQSCFDFKHKMLFIFMCSKEKCIVSKKTFLLEIIGYFIGLVTILCLIFSLLSTTFVSFILLCVNTGIVFIYSCVVTYLQLKSKK